MLCTEADASGGSATSGCGCGKNANASGEAGASAASKWESFASCLAGANSVSTFRDVGWFAVGFCSVVDAADAADVAVLAGTASSMG